MRGIDASAEQIEFCRRAGFDNVACAEALGYLRDTASRFEAIVLSDVLEHIPKSQVIELLEAILERLAPGGQVILRVPNLSNPLNLRTRYVDFTHECGFTRESLAQVLRLAGFEVETVHGAFQLHRRWWRRWLFDRLLWRLFQLFLRHTMHLKRAAVRGKNLIAVGRRPDG